MAKRRKKRLNYYRVFLAGILTIAVIGCSVWVICHHLNQSKDPVVDAPTKPENKPTKDEMSSLYYYDETRKERYEAYQQAHPDLSVDEVVWQVNVDTDIEPYTQMTEISIEDEDNIVLLVNKHFRLRDEYEPVELDYLYDYLEVTPETLEAFEQMASAAALEDLSITAGSTYRSVDYQRDLYQSYVDEDGQAEADTYSARPGSSEHHTGRGIDLVGPDWTLDSFEGTQEDAWIQENAYQYGFIVRYQKETEYITGYIYEPWHITYVGKEAATIMHEKNIETLEEYYVKYVMYQPN